MYMSTVGIAELRQNLSSYLRRVEAGERLTVTDHNRPVAELVPLGERRLPEPGARPRFAPMVVDTGGVSLTDVLIELRGDA
jgi:prevent-host-death family protein